jgi:hypothetical protein
MLCEVRVRGTWWKPCTTATPSKTIDAAWRVVIRRRIEEIESGAVELIDGPESIAVIRADLKARRA